MFSNSLPRRLLLASAVAFLLLYLQIPARTEEPASVKVTVVTILASTDKNAKVDKKLVEVAAAVQPQYPELIGFRFGPETCKSVEIGKEETFDLVDDVKAIVFVQQGYDKKGRVGLKVKAPQLNEITYSTCCHKYFPFVTPYQTKDKKEQVIVAVMVCPCKEK
jgi:hypothetical protein